jgi:hypothetical protein
MTKLTQSERTNIIARHLSGSQDPNYDVIQTRSGGYQCRKRSSPIDSDLPPKTATRSKPSGYAEADDRFDTHKLVEKMYNILNNSDKHNIKHEVEIDPETLSPDSGSLPNPESSKPKRKGANVFGLSQ